MDSSPQQKGKSEVDTKRSTQTEKIGHLTAQCIPEDPLGGGAENSSGVIRSPIGENDLGTATLTPTGDFEAGSWQTFELVYTAGTYGVDDSGSLRICFRFASDQTRPQFDDPGGPNYTVIEASNNAVLQYRYDAKGNVRPWDRTLYIKVVKGFLEQGDKITVRFGDTSGGSKGMRLQTFCEETYEIRVLVDPIATFNYQPLPVQPKLRIVPGPPAAYAAVIPTIVNVNEPFSLRFKGEDRWGNPSHRCQDRFKLRATVNVANLPEIIEAEPGNRSFSVDNLIVAEAGSVQIWLEREDGSVACQTNPMRVVDEPALKGYWADLHGQSEETIGTGSAREFFTFARDFAFVDAVSHQGNDFQITTELWEHLNKLSDSFEQTGSFLVIPGYEWSGNTGLGGDRNIFFPESGRQIRRSSHALLEDQTDLSTDCSTAKELFEAFTSSGETDVICFAHCGGRYADIKLAHDGRIEKSIEIHSSWGTFEWLLHDAFEMGYRVGIVANSDGHKGRPGASYPGASLFGAVGGLTCLLMPELSREALFDCLRKRHHYATTGGHGGRMHLEVKALFSEPAMCFHDDPRLVESEGYATHECIMGDIIHLPEGEVELQIELLTPSPIERVEIFNGMDLLETHRPYGPEELGARIRVIWEGAEYRGRFRQVIWDGEASLLENEITRYRGINFFNPDKILEQRAPGSLAWQALTTGNTGGFDIWLKDAGKGTLTIDTEIVKCSLPVAEIDYEDQIFDNSGVLPRYLKVYRLPDKNPHRHLHLRRKIKLKDKGDNPLFVRLTQEDGTIAWSSPIYMYR